MAKSNLNTQVKRKREPAKNVKRVTKDDKRTPRKEEARAGRGSAAGVAVKQPAAKSPMSVAAAAFIRGMKIRG